MTYEDLLIEAEHNQLIVKELPLPVSKGRIKGNWIAIRTDMNEVEKKCILAEELGHYYTSTGNILDQRDVQNQKQEYKARLWGYNKLIGLNSIVQAYQKGCQSQYEIANFLQVSELYLKEVITCYTKKYGICKDFKGYRIFFEPYLYVEEKSD